MRRQTALLACLAVFTACSELDTVAPPSFSADNGAALVNVMSRNVYLGADIDPLFAAPAEQVPFVAAAIWAEVQATDFPRRAGALAEEIAQARADLVGLQEVALYRLQSPGDAVVGNPVPATMVVLDFLQLLLDSLSARGLQYVAVSTVVNSDVELPVFTGAAPFPFDDVRFTDRDVIIARADVQTSNPMSGVYAAQLLLPIGTSLIAQKRGWTSVDVTVKDQQFRFINTHLEVQPLAPIQVAQALDLIALINASPIPVVLVGDINSAADGSQTPTYNLLISAGMVDIWNRPGDPGYTCCHAKDLDNVQPELDQRIDVIMVRGFGTAGNRRLNATAQLTGHRPGDRARYGIWPSDHAGVIGKLRLLP